MRGMPTVIVRDGVHVEVYSRDHQPPHVHAKTGSGKVVVYLSDEKSLQWAAEANVTKSDVRKAVNVVQDHLADCWAMWRRYRP